MRQRNIHEKFNVLCQLFADSNERSIAGGHRLAVGGGDAAGTAGRHGPSISLFQPVRGIESAKAICGVCRNFYTRTKSHKNRQTQGYKPLV